MMKYRDAIIKYGKQFKMYFNLSLSQFACFVLGSRGVWSFDIIKFDKWMKDNRGYKEEEHGSLHDFINKEYGIDEGNFIEKIM